MVDIFIIVLIIALNAYFSLAELALVSVTKQELSEEELLGNSNARDTLKLIKDPEQFLSVVQVGTTLLGLIEGIYGGSVVAAQLETWLISMGLSSGISHIGSMIFGIGTITYLTIVFGELVPKSIALQCPLRISLSIAPSLLLFSKIAYPFIKILTYSTHKILGLFSIKTRENKKISENDIRSMLSTALQQGLLEKSQLWMHENVIAFKNRTAGSIMKPARITLTLSYDWSKQQVRELIGEKPYAYFPVINGSKEVIGILKTKSFLLSESSDWHNSVEDAYFINSESLVRDVFAKFQENRRDFGIVNDNKGYFLGILTIQDIMEAVFGDMPELEDYSKYVYKQSDKVWIVEDFIHLQRVRKTLKLDWLRSYESMYLSIGEMLRSEIASIDQSELILHGVSFKWQSSNNQNSQIIISIP